MSIKPPSNKQPNHDQQTAATDDKRTLLCLALLLLSIGFLRLCLDLLNLFHQRLIHRLLLCSQRLVLIVLSHYRLIFSHYRLFYSHYLPVLGH